jgi:trehalose 6-phosphate phosphatase
MLADLRDRVDLVAITSGRPTQQLRELIPVPGLVLVGMYGLGENQGRDRILACMADVERAAALVPEAWVEDKGVSLAVHYRAAPDPGRARALLSAALAGIASSPGLTLLEGKMVVEVAAGEVPGKGAAIRRLARDHSLAGCLFAGDDQPDLDAFAALDGLAAAGLSTLKVAVRTEETPGELISDADLVVDRPEGLVRLLSGL